MASELTIIKNKKATYEYQIETTYEAGIVLTGTEIKSIRKSQVSLDDSYCTFQNGELFVMGMHIAEYKEGTVNNHVTKRDRKLLLHKTELKKLLAKVKMKGYTIIPTRVFINSNGYAKIDIGLARGKKVHDKRQDLKKREADREMDAIKKNLQY
jgi:SsrA-binding protein